MKYEDTKPCFKPGQPEPHKDYRKALIVASIQTDNMTWLDIHLLGMEHYVYVNDDPDAEYTVPMNKGNEVMTYLTFLIDHYDKLPEIMLFVHAHEATNHNPWLLHTSMPEMAKAISPQRIIREGYLNMHCGAWALGDCPAGIRPAQGLPFTERKQAWEELFPQYPIPAILAQSCCAQFAVSRERVLQIPRDDFIRYRQWLLDTDMPDRISGYIWEYLWQFIFKGEHVYCPPQDECYCDGYGVCMSEKQFKEFNNLYFASLPTRDEIDRITRVEKEGIKEDPKYALPKVEQERRENLATVLDETREVMFGMRKAAFERGKDPQVRAAAAHLKWEDGDGFV
ncbi:hypothetical protein EJ03DRAFT_269909 [Teratosphaeria nubilosa]|uniref:DUF3431 domain-containing protein n=1 Tax=Teratosphaeria nubilosa TaxID=161662 RepID=A0A6G1LDC8_9PEZI|nr:hypothetical protein EJ03DRAFT_269909 [Teratosphaeria nubilosa]